jgi:hypothetical protein
MLSKKFALQVGRHNADSYGSLSIVAARSFALLLELVDPALIGMVACVRSKSTGPDVIEILLGCAAEWLHLPCPPIYKLPGILQTESHAHIYTLRQYLLHLQTVSEPSDTVTDTFSEHQRAQLVKKIKDALPHIPILCSKCCLRTLHPFVILCSKC